MLCVSSYLFTVKGVVDEGNIVKTWSGRRCWRLRGLGRCAGSWLADLAWLGSRVWRLTVNVTYHLVCTCSLGRTWISFIDFSGR